MSYRPNSQYHQITGDFVLASGESCVDDVLLKDGNLTVKSGATFVCEVKVAGTVPKVTLEEHTFIYHLHMMNGGEIYFKGEHVLVVELIIENHVILHIPKSWNNWKHCFETISNNDLITIVQDID